MLVKRNFSTYYNNITQGMCCVLLGIIGLYVHVTRIGCIIGHNVV